MERTPQQYELDISVHGGSGWLVAAVVGIPGVFAQGPDLAALMDRAKRIIARRLGDVDATDVAIIPSAA